MVLNKSKSETKSVSFLSGSRVSITLYSLFYCFITSTDPEFIFFRALGALIFKGILFVMFMTYPLPGEDLKWKRSPSLPMQELTKRFGSRTSKSREKEGRASDRTSDGHRRPGHHRTRPVPPIPSLEKPLQFAPEVCCHFVLLYQRWSCMTLRPSSLLSLPVQQTVLTTTWTTQQQRVPLEIIDIEMEDDLDIRPLRHHDPHRHHHQQHHQSQYRRDYHHQQDPYGTIVWRKKVDLFTKKY